MRRLLGFLTVVSLGAPAISQIPAQSATGAVALQAPDSASCPVGFEARHAQQGAVVNVGPAPRHPEQSYRITLTSRKGSGIAQAKITLHGLSGHQIVPAGERSRADATESFDITPSADQGLRFHSTVYIEKLTGVQWVDLDELTYTDGTKWHESPAATCRVAPNGYMLVSGNGQ